MFRSLVVASFLGLCAGVIWQYRRVLLSELDVVKTSVNQIADAYEGWQVIVATCTFSVILSCAVFFLYCAHSRKSPRSFIRRKAPKRADIVSNNKQELSKAIASLEKKVFGPKPGETYRTKLPKKGLSHDTVMKEVENLLSLAHTELNKVSPAMYNSSPELTKLATAVFEKTVWSNPLHPELFPHIRKMEAEVVQWTVDLFNGGEDVCGVMTSGGTESIIMAMKSYREWAYEEGIKCPEIVCPMSTHSAFIKAAEYLGMEIIKVPTDPRTQKVDLKAMARAITSNTIVLVGSAPQFPHGIVDPIQDIAKLARKHGIGMHVDCCLGGFILPFMEKAGFEIDPFDFRIKGVTSISADTHKYGYAPKGTSVLLYSNKALRQKQYFVDAEWQGSVYVTPGIQGSRAGCMIATTWATLMYMGEDGYVDATKRIITTTRNMIEGLEGIPGIRIVGKPRAMTFAIISDDFNVHHLADVLSEKGWQPFYYRFPVCFNFMTTMVHTKPGVAAKFMSDVREGVALVKQNPTAQATGFSVLMEALAQPSTTPQDVCEVVHGYIDLSLKATPPDNASL